MRERVDDLALDSTPSVAEPDGVRAHGSSRFNTLLIALGKSAKIVKIFKILKLLKADEATHIDEIVELLELQLSSSEIFAALFELELAGKVKQMPGKNFVKSF